MDYHSDRFIDHSLLIYDDKGKVIALFPANENNKEIHSHQGLTFGGVITDNKMTTSKMLDIFELITAYYKKHSIGKVYYKAIPHIYTSVPAEEDRYALFRLKASRYRADVSTTICRDRVLPYQTLRKRMIKKASNVKLDLREDTCLVDFWALLSKVLRLEHGTNPVHTLDEITLLRTRFPENIRCHGIYFEDELIAGVLVFSNEGIAHCQYIAANMEARKIGALDYLIDQLINIVYKDKKYFDFGTSNEENGLVLNTGLIFQKEGFGARAIVHDFYEINIDD
ncbi:GNAT family N-acetyltransferase [Vibrio mediterranei]|nr:GNAT family N-acetyltransferase [Vibrio mediterranei]